MIRLESHPDCSLLSFQEERALPWIMNSGGLSSNVNAAISSRVVVDATHLLACVRAACDTHDALRTRFHHRAGGDGRFEREVLPRGEYRFAFVEEHVDHVLADTALRLQVNTFCNKAFTADDPHWLRVLLVHTRDRASVIVVSMPHIVSDAVSIRVLIADIWKDYADLAEGIALSPRHTGPSLQDFAGSQRAWGATPDFAHKLDALADLVAGGMARIRAAHPAIYAGPALPSRPSLSVVRTLPPLLSAQLENLAQSSQTSISTVLVAGAALAIARLFERREFCFRLPFANRSLPGTASLIGFLSNDVPIFISIDAEQSLIDFVKSLCRHAFGITTRFGAIPWSVLTTRLKEMGTLLPGRNPFDDYLINVFPAATYLRPREGYDSLNFQLSLNAFTCNELKIWLHVVHGDVIMTAKVGEDQREIAEAHYIPTIIETLENAVRNPAGKLAMHL